MASRVKYIVFGLGMLVLAAGIVASLVIILVKPGRTPQAQGSSATLAASQGISLAQTLESTLGLGKEEAASLAAKLAQAAAVPPTAGSDRQSLAQALQTALGLSQEGAANLAQTLQAAQQGQATPTVARATPAGRGTSERASIGDDVDFVVNDASGKVKQSGTGK